MAGKKSNSWTPEQLVEYYQRQGKALPDDARRVLGSLGLGKHLRPEPEPPKGLAEVEALLAGKKKAKRKGVDVAPIVASLKAPLVYTAVTDQPTLSLWFDGARMFTVNELFSIQQYRKHEVFGYKKAWRKLIERAIEMVREQHAVPRFEGPTRLWLYRRGQKKVDLDSLPAMFKYAIDSLRREGVISDDNPEIIVEPRLLQEVGMPAVGMRLERLWDWEGPSLANLKQEWLGLEAPAPLDRVP